MGLDEYYIQLDNGTSEWLTGSFSWAGACDCPYTLVHELGHALGLNHHGGFNGLTGWMDTYGSQVDVMGVVSEAHFGAMYKARLGWIDAEDVTTITADGVYGVSVAEQAGAEAARIYLPPNEKGERWLWLSAREEAGADATVVIDTTQQFVYGSNQSVTIPHAFTLDATPETQTIRHNRDSHLHPGRSWSDPTLGLTITNIGATPTGAQLEVHLSDGSPNTAPTIASVNSIIEVVNGEWVASFEVVSNDTEQSELSIFWDFGLAVDHGQYLLGEHGSGASTTHTFASEPNHRVRVVVSDRHGGETWGWVDLGTFTGSEPTIGQINTNVDDLKVTFTVSNNDDEALIWTWDFDDNSSNHFRTPIHDYATYGTYEVTLRVSDGETTIERTTTITLTAPA